MTSSLWTPDTLRTRLAALDLVTPGVAPARRQAAVAMVLRLVDGDADVLLMRRREHPRDRWSGQISLPGGHQEPGEDLTQTAQRETHEEVGVALDEAGLLLGQLSPVQAKARGKPVSTVITPFVFVCEQAVEPTPGIEAQEAFWFPLGRAAAGEFDSTYRYQRDDVTLQLPAWHYEARTVWGLTHEMLTTLIAVARG